MITTPFDLLREKRLELGLPEPAEAARLYRQSLLKGLTIGSALLGLALGAAGLVALRSAMVTTALTNLSTVEGEVAQFEARVRSEQGRLAQTEQANGALVRGLLGVRSGSALLRDLQQRVPQGIQLTEAKAQGTGAELILKGVALDPQPFAAINALQLQLKRSPLVDPLGVVLRKASRADQQQARPEPGPRLVSFELAVRFRPANTTTPQAEKRVLELLGSQGLARRLTLLQQEGLLR
ncbi:MAG: PilN domain-containing protein [Cyanobium sp.]|nr:PilN domain-containing protein [Cyanobium sp.]